ncbi:MAG: hypothetical protein NE330_16280 [Lentisphaeraceae bacterium]|nr:hypothetical protein [Lentisphaeraceae bacterium]
MDQVTLIGPEDFNALDWHIKANDKYNSLSERTFYIYAETGAGKEYISKFYNRDDLIFIPESSLVDPEIFPNKWIYQQLLKLSVDSLRDEHNLTELFLFTDVDTIPIKEITKGLFIRHDKPLYYLSTTHSKCILTDTFVPPEDPLVLQKPYLAWHYAMTKSTEDILGIKAPTTVSAIDACTLWSQKTLKRLKRHIEKVHDLPWPQAILKCFIHFAIDHQKLFQKRDGFRSIEFCPDLPTERPATVGLNDLLHNLRLGFSEWQLYAHFHTFVDPKPNRWLGLLGKTPAPHVSEFNTETLDTEILDNLLQQEHRPSFLYFYPNVKGAEETLKKYFD